MNKRHSATKITMNMFLEIHWSSWAYIQKISETKGKGYLLESLSMETNETTN